MNQSPALALVATYLGRGFDLETNGKGMICYKEGTVVQVSGKGFNFGPPPVIKDTKTKISTAAEIGVIAAFAATNKAGNRPLERRC